METVIKMITISSEIISNLNGKEKILEKTYREQKEKKVIERSWISSAIQTQDFTELMRGKGNVVYGSRQTSSNYSCFPSV